MITAGIDVGSRSIKVALWDDARGKLGMGCCDQGVHQESLARELFHTVCTEAGVIPDAVERIVATGYGRRRVHFANTTVTEITCHALGVRSVVPNARSIIEIGGQDSKLIHLDSDGAVRDFTMNDRCAAGTGRFIEVVAERLGYDVNTLGELAGESQNPAAISSMCMVFAESEIIGLMADGIPGADIANGVLTSIANRVTAMAGRGFEQPVVFTGGVALAPYMATRLEEALDMPLLVAPEPQFTGAVGAALAAAMH